MRRRRRGGQGWKEKHVCPTHHSSPSQQNPRVEKCLYRTPSCECDAWWRLQQQGDRELELWRLRPLFLHQASPGMGSKPQIPQQLLCVRACACVLVEGGGGVRGGGQEAKPKNHTHTHTVRTFKHTFHNPPIFFNPSVYSLIPTRITRKGIQHHAFTERERSWEIHCFVGHG